MVWKFVAKHDPGLADRELRMSDLALMGDAQHLHRAERIFVKCDGFAGVADRQIGDGPFVSLGYRLDSLAHLSSPRFTLCSYSFETRRMYDFANEPRGAGRKSRPCLV